MEKSKEVMSSVAFSNQQAWLKCPPLEKPESSLAAWFKQARESNASIDGTHLKEKALHITTRLWIADFSAYSGWSDRFKKGHNNVYWTLSGEGKSVDPETVEDRKNYWLLREIEAYELCDIYIMLMRHVYFSVYILTRPSLFEVIFAKVV
jgi:hypothetical protein